MQEGDIDVAYRSLSATDIDDLRATTTVKVIDGPGGEIRYIVFNFNTQPYGATTPEADPAKALAVRQAVADLDRPRGALDAGLQGHLHAAVLLRARRASPVRPSRSRPLRRRRRRPDADKAKPSASRLPASRRRSSSACSTTRDHYGPSSGDEYALIKDQLEATGLFTVDLQSTEWVQYSKDRTADVYPAYQLGWFPDYSDADNYLTPFFLTNNFLGNHYEQPGGQRPDPRAGRRRPTPAARTALIEEIQDTRGERPLDRAAASRARRSRSPEPTSTGVDDTLDASFKFRFAALSKG